MQPTHSRTAKPNAPRQRWHLSLALALLLAPVAASAAPSETDRTLAQSLFEDGRRLMNANDFVNACPKLQESQRLDPSGGTVLNLALCREQEGKLATAWAYFKQALSAAKRDDRADREEAASKHLALLEAKIPSVKINVTTAAPGEEVLVDGVVVGTAGWGTRMALDPGRHELSARANEREPWSHQFALEVGQSLSFDVPALAPQQASAPAGSGEPPARAEREQHGSSTVGWVVAGAGVVGLGVGSFFGLQALSKQAETKPECPTKATCSDRGLTLSKQANTDAWISNVGFGIGLVSLAAGTYLLLSSGDGAPQPAASSTPRVRLAAGPRGGQLNVEGTW